MRRDRSESRSPSPRKRPRADTCVLPPSLCARPGRPLTDIQIGGLLVARALGYGATTAGHMVMCGRRHSQRVSQSPESFIREAQSANTNCQQPRIRSRNHSFPDIMRFLFTIILNPTLPLRDILDQIADFGCRMSRRTAGRIMSSMGFRRRRRVCRPLLTVQQRLDRVAFCKMLVLDRRVADDIIFTDESYVEFHETGTHITFLPGFSTPYSSERPKSVKRFLIWSAVGRHVGLMPFVVVPLGSMVDAQLYQNIIADHFLPWIRDMSRKHPGTRFIFQQDGASAHTANTTLGRLDEMFGTLRDDGVNILRLSGWPANSPDISPIESVWAILKGLLRRYRRQGLPLWMALTFGYYVICRDDFIDRLWCSWRACVWRVLQLSGGNHHRQTHIKAAATGAEPARIHVPSCTSGGSQPSPAARRFRHAFAVATSSALIAASGFPVRGGSNVSSTRVMWGRCARPAARSSCHARGTIARRWRPCPSGTGLCA
eukprot:TRINITY_DN571_c0_g2_i2.p1 TRINITY_DN571_c0_g2~~TRINITY_DN571_c0_g2_i2.p1  ORF type:complete len:487 (+),score=48.80 TRINITY_DN571_c0_g2_i2:337-1797(+)